MPNYLVVSTSGNPDSNSRRMGETAFDWLKKAKVNYVCGSILMLTATASISIAVYQLIGGHSQAWYWAGAGACMFAVTIPLAKGIDKHAIPGIGFYNSKK